MTNIKFLAGVCALAGAAISAQGAFIAGAGSWGSYTGSLSYSAGTSELTIVLKNTSPALNGGFITGFVFNIMSADAGAFSTLITFTHPFLNLFNESASPYGNYKGGAALGGDWLGGGSPNAGIAVGATGTFVFKITASDAGSLTDASFLSIPNASEAFLVRFKGFVNGESDKVTIPAPGAFALLGLGGLVAARRRR
ncbi:MAG: hypothetical protein KF691_07970 [Phycisphaeraceae bacterium]|nr:hypothetical protein [Phycisphaeraceae bacterium]